MITVTLRALLIEVNFLKCAFMIKVFCFERKQLSRNKILLLFFNPFIFHFIIISLFLRSTNSKFFDLKFNGKKHNLSVLINQKT